MAARGRRPGRITVAAGTNGAGKSSIVGAFIANSGGAYYNPDIEAARLRALGHTGAEADAIAWRRGYTALGAAIDANSDFTFETTLGGSSITIELLRALAFERELVIFYVGLATPELHIQRVRERVARGGHDIPEAKIRARFDSSRTNLLSFIGTRASLRVWDNSHQTADGSVAAEEVFAMRERRLVLPEATELEHTIPWARPLVARALQVCRSPRRGR